MVEAENVYTSCGCNRLPRCLDWSENGLIAYASCHSIILFEPLANGQGKVVQTLVHHKKLVTSVQWITNRGSKFELLSTSADHTAILWTKQSSWSFAPEVLTGHLSVVRVATGLYLSNGHLLISTAAADSSLKIWRKSDNVECIQSISLGNSFALDLKLAVFDTNVPVLFMAGDDSKIYLYTMNNNFFVPSTTLYGHTDWIQSIDYIATDNKDLLLVSSSQDNYIRIWKISSHGMNDGTTIIDDEIYLNVKKQTFNVQENKTYYVSLESVLSGHENWIYSVRWQRCFNNNSHADGDKYNLQILSASMDKTIIIWEFDILSNLWLEKARFGEIGGNTLGFYGAVFSPDGTSIIAHGYHGAIHLWNYNEELNIWQPGVTFGGHFDSVRDISWDPSGTYLLSCSYDQTTRLHAPVPAEDGKNYWHELARPQVHGYDMVCLSSVNQYQFVSAGDEKILRVFKAPQSFAENLENICHIDTSLYLKNMLPKGASVPALGLSNKAVFEDDLEKASRNQEEKKHFKDIYPEFNFTPVVLTEPPTEEVLIQNTLWPEVQKLYGHPYEVFTVACNHQGTVIASACKASKVEHAAIIFWDTKTWKQLGQLAFHTLTVTQMEFSPNDEYLISVSRDRMWAIYQAVPEQIPPYQKVAHYDKKLGVHNRIIWSCSWSHDNLHFTTASRDKKIAVWGPNENGFQLSSPPLDVEDSATAISFAPCLSEQEKYIVAIGFENGRILICLWAEHSVKKDHWTSFCLIDRNLAHHQTVNRLKFAPMCKNNKDYSKTLLLASCGSDNMVRIRSISNI